MQWKTSSVFSYIFSKIFLYLLANGIVPERILIIRLINFRLKKCIYIWNQIYINK